MVDGCRNECRALLEFHAALIAQFSNLESSFAPWKQAVVQLSLRPDLESLEGEQELECLALEFRSVWLRCVKRHASTILKSPPHYDLPRSMLDEVYTFPYDRWSRPTQFERAYGKTISTAQGWKARHYFFGNAMSALATFVLQCRKSFSKSRVTILGHKGYFEILTMMDLLDGQDIVGFFTTGQKKFNAFLAKGDGDIVLFEPVFADKMLSVWNQEAFLEAWKRRPNRSSTIILIDTSLVGYRFDVQDFLSCLNDFPPALVVQVVSAMKLHQLGLEFSNLGVLSIYKPKSLTVKKLQRLAVKKLQRRTLKNLRLVRQTFGTGANFDEYLAIEFPMLVKNEFFKKHCDQVFRNNELLARAMVTGGLLKEVVHPVLGPARDRPWAVSPFVYFRLNEGTTNDSRFLRRLLQNEAKRRGLTFQPGSSFGFRSHRFEMGIFDEKGETTFRVDMGARDGPSVEGVIILLKEVLACDSINALRTAFPDVRHPDDTH